MIDQYRETAQVIRANAKKILETKGVGSEIKKMGELFYTGSYALDLMTWNDLDMQVVLKEGVDPIESFSTLLSLIAAYPGFIEGLLSDNYKEGVDDNYQVRHHFDRCARSLFRVTELFWL